MESVSSPGSVPAQNPRDKKDRTLVVPKRY